MASYIRYQNKGATRNRPLDDDLVRKLSYLEDMGVTAEVFSGGQPGIDEGGSRVGSTRHDHGHAGDMHFYKDGRKLDWASEEDQPIFREIVQNGKAAGITGWGAGDGYMQPGSMHVGMGSAGVWGKDGKGDNAAAWLRDAYNGGTSPTGPRVRDNPTLIEDVMMAGGNPTSPPNPTTDPNVDRRMLDDKGKELTGIPAAFRDFRNGVDDTIGVETADDGTRKLWGFELGGENGLGAGIAGFGKAFADAETNQKAPPMIQPQGRTGGNTPVQIQFADSIVNKDDEEELRKRRLGGLAGFGGFTRRA
ncbi:hypothetical protein [Agrobacterium rosae]|uniref:Uncharacterized protein n=1 Tax=Agrobacterium rosae TaxID=1972867 RepID=A0A1R3TUB6_9HYPH|nr:hypothetical protein [Agrobacterium rosae]SCX19610.1 hypothetical protein DSM25559_1869 [Agrobacterium rosae]